MAEENEVVEQSAEDIATASEASKLGWVPEEKYRGKKDHWVDAKTFLERGKTILPILKENNERMRHELGQTTNELKELKETLRATNAAIAAMKESHDADVKEQVEAARRDLLTQIKAARTADDVDTEVGLIDQLSRLDAAQKKVEKKEEAPPAKPASGVDPVFTAWVERPENSWWRTDPEKQARAVGAAAYLRAIGDTSIGEAFYDKVIEQLDKTAAKPPSKAESASHSRSSGNGKSFDDLPADVRAQCDKDAKTYSLVGANRAHKDLASWRKSFTEQYFRE